MSVSGSLCHHPIGEATIPISSQIQLGWVPEQSLYLGEFLKATYRDPFKRLGGYFLRSVSQEITHDYNYFKMQLQEKKVDVCESEKMFSV